jgi:hypothetical protein
MSSADRAVGPIATLRTGDESRTSPTIFDGAVSGPTLDELLASVWERLTVHAVVECPLCGGQMEPQYAAQALPIGGRCGDCGSTLS